MQFESLLYKYFSNSLTATEKEQFNELLATDEEFKAQFEFEKNVQQAIQATTNADLKRKLKTFETKFKESKTVKKTTFSMWKVAASVALLIAVSYFGYQSFFTLNADNLYTENYTVYPNTVFSITRSDDGNSTERQAFVAYETENYQQAINKFNEAVEKEYFNFYKAQAYLNLGETSKAKALFKKTIENNQQFTAESYWYLALINIKEEDISAAKKYLQVLVKNYNYNKEKANKILKKIN